MRTSTVYLLHFSAPIAPGQHTAQHYMGSAADLDARLAEHANGTGSRLCQVAKERGNTFELARTWEAPDGTGRQLERQLKNRKAGPRLCPICEANRKAQKQH